MKLVCPCCGAAASADAWENDATVRAFIATAAQMAAAVQPLLLGYLRLFRPGSGRGLSWKKALRLARELGGMVAMGHIQVEHLPARPAAPALWAEAMRRMEDAPPRRLPLTTHGYLCKIVYDLADEADRARETAANKAEREGRNPKREAEPARIDREELRRIRMQRFPKPRAK